MEAAVPVRSLSTGMKVRDEHMQKYIFTTPDGQMPDVIFSADGGACKFAGSNRDLSCRLSGNLKIRGVSHAVSINVIAKQQNAKAFRATLDTTVKLSDFNIEAPSQFGVKTSNDVKLHFEFIAREAVSAVTAARTGK
jgi:polyisoprenoid-binding protein YceI